MSQCCMCGRSDVPLDWCEECQKSFCADCKKKYPARIRAMILDAARNPRGFARKAGKVLKLG